MSVFTRAARRLLSCGPRVPLCGRRFVFCLHDVSEPDAPQHAPEHSATPKLFAEQLEALGRWFDLVGLNDLLAERVPRGRAVAALTFDDGLRSVLEHAEPESRARGVPIAVFACRAGAEMGHLPAISLLAGRDDPAYMARAHEALFGGAERDPAAFRQAPLATLAGVEDLDVLVEPRWTPSGSRNLFMDAADLRRLHQRGVLLGSHSATHRVLSRCDEESLAEEIDGSLAWLGDLIGEPVRHFAVPYGKREHCDRRVLARCAAAGVSRVYGSNPAAVPRSGASWPIPRISLAGESPGEIAYLINRAVIHPPDL